MRVCVVAEGKEATRADREAAALRAAGHRVTLIPLGRARLVPFPLSRVVQLVAALRRLWRCAPHVVHAIGPASLAIAICGARLRSSALVYDARAPAREIGGRWRLGARLAERLAMRRCNAVVASSRAGAVRFQEVYGLATLPVVVRDVVDGLRPRKPPADLRGRLRLGSAPLVLLDGNGLSPQRCEIVFRALAETPQARLAVLGADRWTWAEDVHLMAERLRVAGRVHLLKTVPEQRLPTYAADADVALVFDEDAASAFPRCLFSYAAAGTPLIAAQSSRDLRETVEEHGAGWIVDVAEPAAIAEALQRGCHSERSLRQPSVRRMAEALTWRIEAARLTALYERLPLSALGAPSRGNRRREWLRRARALLSDLRTARRRRSLRRPRAFALYAWGRNLRAAGRYEPAATVFSRAVERDPGEVRYGVALAGALKDARRTEDAISAFRALFEAQGEKITGVAVNAAINLARLGDRAAARTLLDSLSTSEGGGALRWVRMAELHAAVGEVGEAGEEAARALELTDERPLRVRCSRVLEQAGEPTRARQATGSAGAQRRLLGTLRTLDAEWLPSLPSARAGYEPAPGRVLNLLETSLPHATAGYAHRSATVLAAQRAAGLEPVAATRIGFPATRGIGDYSLVETVRGVIHHRFPLPGVRRATSIPADELLQRNARMLHGLVQASRPAAIQAATPHLNCLLGLALRKEFDIPLLYDVRGFPEMTWAVREGGDRSEVYRRRRETESRCFREADGVVTLSQVMRDHIVERGVSPDRVHIVPHAVDVEELQPAAADADLARHYGLTGKLVVGYLGSLLEYEGIDVLLRAVALARAERRDVAALVVGDGAAAPALRELARALDLEEHVVFTGPIPAIRAPDHYSLLDVFVCPRKDLEVCRLVTPLKPFEAMAAGRCVVVSDLPALTEPLAGGENGRSFRPGDEKDLADVICQLADDPRQRAELGARARDFIVARHSRTAATAAVRAAFGSLDASFSPVS